MRQILLNNLFFWISFSILAQNPYYDAVKLKNLVKPDTVTINNKLETLSNRLIIYQVDSAKFQNILVNYLDVIPEDYSTLAIAFESNPFIRLTKSANLSIDEKQRDFQPQPKLPLSKIGGLDVTTIVDGLAKFMVERTKQELNVWFFEKFRDQLKNTRELKVLFPITSLHLEAIGSEIYNYSTYIPSLRQSFEQDLSALFVNLPELLDHPDYKNIFDSIPEVLYTLEITLHLINQPNSNMHPGDIIHGFPPAPDIDQSLVNLYNGIQVIDLFSQSLRSKSKDRYWISQDSLKLLADEKVFRIYLGLIYQQMDSDIVFQIKTKEVDIIVNFKNEFKKIAKSLDEISKYHQFIEEFSSKAETTELALKKIRETKSEDGVDPENIYAFLHASIELIDFSTSITELPYVSDLVPDNLRDTLFTSTREYIKVAENGADLYLNISERNYGTAIINLLEITDFAFNDMVLKNSAKKLIKYSEEKSHIKSNTTLSQEEKENKNDKLKWKKEELEKLKNIHGQILKYGTFMATVVQAKTSDDVKTIIESVALPPGSFRTKRESQCNISLNSFLGFTSGWEFIKNVGINTNLEKKKWLPNNIALSAPVGLAFSWGGKKKKDPSKRNADKGRACGLFLSVIDIGAMASFRFADDNSAIASTVKLQNILAPGLFYSYHFRNAPVSLLVGGQMGPLLREVSAIDFKVEDNIYYRLGFSMVVDIPIFDLYNNPEY